MDGKRMYTAEDKRKSKERAKRWRAAKKTDEEFKRNERIRVSQYARRKADRSATEQKLYNKGKRENMEILRAKWKAKKEAELGRGMTAVASPAQTRRVTRSTPQVVVPSPTIPMHPSSPRSGSVIPSEQDAIAMRLDATPISAPSEQPLQPLKVKLQFYNRNRQMKRKMIHMEVELSKKKRQIASLQKKLTAMKGPLKRNALTTPQKEAYCILRDEGVSPSKAPKLTKELTSFKSIIHKFRHANTNVKRSLLSISHPKGTKGTKSSRCLSFLAKSLKISRKSLIRNRNKKNHTKLAQRKIQVVVFLQRPDNSSMLPGKKDALKGGRRHRYGLSDTLSNLYMKFCLENPNSGMSLSTFCKLRPNWFKLVQWTQRRQCLCMRHQNASLKLKAVSGFGTSPTQFCANNTDADILTKLDAIPDRTLKFRGWKKVNINFNGAVINKVKLTDVELTKGEFIETFQAEFKEFRSHAFRVAAQYDSIHLLKYVLQPEGQEVTIQMDYSENYQCRYQDEVSQVFYDQNQVTLHPMVVHFRDTEGELHSLSFVCISEERAHSCPTTYAFIRHLIPLLKSEFPALQKVHYITDSPASQYHNRYILYLTRQHLHEFGISATWQYLESGHGKGPCDGVGGTIKRMVETEVKKGKVVATAEQFYLAVKALSTKLRLILVPTSEVKSCKSQVNRWDAPQVKGISLSHSIMPYNGFIYMKETSCFSCCYTDGIFQPTCEGWVKTDIPARESGDDQTVVVGPVEENRLVVENVPRLSVALRQLVDAEGDTGPSTVVNASIVNNASPSKTTASGPYVPFVGQFVSAVYDNNGYIGLVLELDPNEDDLRISFMEHAGGKFKWGQKDQVWVFRNDILCSVAPPTKTGRSNRILDITPDEKMRIEVLFKCHTE